MTDTQTANTEPAPSDSSLKQPVDEMLSQRIGQYRVVRRIGRGGMGVVYEAVHETIGQRIAVKTLNQELSANPAFVKRFLTEARATVIAQHPGLVKVFDYGQIPDGPLYLQMEYLEGETLAKRLLKTGKLPIETTIRWIRQIASAMALAHARDIVHRDDYVISTVCFHVGHFGPQRRRNRPCPLTVPAAARSALTCHHHVIQITQ